MRKVNFSKNAALTAAVFGVGILVQACGAGSGSSSSAVTSAPCVPGPGVSCVTPSNSQQNATLYGACQSVQSAQYALSSSGIPGNIVGDPSYVTSTDGTETCEVTFNQTLVYAGGGQGPRAFLGPSSASQYGLGEALSLGVNVGPYDQLSINVSGNYSTGGFVCSPSTSITGLAYGWVSGVNYFLLNGSQQVIPANGGGTVYGGLNQTIGSDGGCMTMSGSATITRCVDSGGTPHPC